jgi:hypothetical protein
MNLLKLESLSHPKAPMQWGLLLMIASLIVMMPLSFFDTRLVTGALVWIKPIKFAFSIAIYAITFLWLLQFVDTQAKIVKIISWIMAITLMIESIAIWLQAYRGESSHFNITSPFNSFLFSLMGVGIFIFWIAHLMFAFKILRTSNLSPLLKECLLWGLLISAYGMIIGFFMTMPRPEQLELMKQGVLKMSGGHTFGAEDGGPGISFFGWSTEAGDMRVPHFFGMHGLQYFSIVAILIFGFDAQRKVTTFTPTSIRLLGISLLGITITMNIQALSGESIFKSSGGYLVSYFIFSLLALLSFLLLLPQMKIRTNQSALLQKGI